jgi:hypothetical protein
MERGTYTGHRVDFKNYAVSFFNPHLFSDSISSHAGCGACALAMLTGTDPGTVAAKNGNRHYADDFMLRFLRRQQFKVLALTLCNVSTARSDLGPDNVILVSQLFTRNEGTWGIIFQCNYYHNFSIYSLNALSMLNKPVLSAYVVFHPKWRLQPLSSEKAAPKLAPKSNRLTLGSLRPIMRRASANPRRSIGK